ncbi:pilin N-terminal domain-containing protein [Enterococcus avium]
MLKLRKKTVVLTVILCALANTHTISAFADSSSSDQLESTETTQQSTTSSSSESSITLDSSEETSTIESSDETVPSEDLRIPTIKNKQRQKIKIQKLLSQDSITDGGKKQNVSEGVNGAHFSVYDISNLYEEVASQNTDKDLSSLQDKLSERANKLNVSSEKKVTEGDTKTVDGSEGVFEFTTEPNESKYEAYYVVNDSVPEDVATLSEPFVIIMPITDENGETMDEIWIYPKSSPVEPVKEVKKLAQTGAKLTPFERFMTFISNLIK